MQIIKKIYEEVLVSVSECPPETGGILGGKDGWIAYVEFDAGINSDKKCSYTPNTKVLNKIIQSWQNQRISFRGIFHTHYFGVETLSAGDVEYIEKIMKSMPEHITKLYFPLIVMPQRKMIAYVAVKEKEKINIYQEKILFQEE